MTKIAVLGSTGSIGTQTLDIVSKNEDLQVVGLAAGRNIDLLEKQIRARYNDPASADLRVNKASMEMELSSLFRHQVKNVDAQKAKEEIAAMLFEHQAKKAGA